MPCLARLSEFLSKRSSQRHTKLCCVISDIVDNFIAGKDQPQNNQTYGQACGQPYLVSVEPGQRAEACQVSNLNLKLGGIV